MSENDARMKDRLISRAQDSDYESAREEMVLELGEREVTRPGTEPQVIYIPDPTAGSYQITLVGTEAGGYTLTVRGYVGEDEVSVASQTGTIFAGLVHETYPPITRRRPCRPSVW